MTPPKAANTVILINPFFRDIGLLLPHESGGFIPSAELIAYNKACLWGTDAAQEKLRTVFERTWFYRCLIPRLQLAAQSTTNCIAVLAEESGAEKEHEERLTNLLLFLSFAGIVRISDGKVNLLKHMAPIPNPVLHGDKNKSKDAAVLDGPPKKINQEFTDQEEQSLYLDKEKKRRFTINSPLFLSRSEYDRICKWIEVTLIVEDAEQKMDNKT